MSGREMDWEAAQAAYAEIGVDVESALKTLDGIQISLHCWQGDDVVGFEPPRGAASGGGIQVTGNHPGRARTPAELRADLEAALALVPGRHRLNLHAMYGEFDGRPADRDAILPEHYAGWVAWARERGVGLDFNATCFAHPLADGGYTLAAKDAGVRAFWCEHVRRCREIGAWMGAELGTPCVHNLWIPDGAKDTTVDRMGHRRLLLESLDGIYGQEHDRAVLIDAVESKLFGIGSESFVAGSHEFYLAYALTRGLHLCLDLGHFHPTEEVDDKLSALLPFLPGILLHLSRGIRWDSDHVVILDDRVRAVAAALVRSGGLGKVRVALDFFDASLNRVGAWVTGARAVQQALLLALLEPRERLLAQEEAGDLYGRLALLERCKTLPWGAIWDGWCRRHGVPVGLELIEKVGEYGRRVAGERDLA